MPGQVTMPMTMGPPSATTVNNSAKLPSLWRRQDMWKAVGVGLKAHSHLISYKSVRD